MWWDDRFMQMAALVATWSKDPAGKVGAVIVDSSNRVVSIGFNGFPRGTSDSQDLYEDRDEKIRRVMHAEANAILFAQRDLSGCTLYSTRQPCGQCAAMAIQAGISRVVYLKSISERWKDDYETSRSLFKEAGVNVIEITLEFYEKSSDG